MKDAKQEFIDLAKLSGWDQAEIARRLNMSRGGVNGIITGKKIPGARLVEWFRLKLYAEKPELMTAKYPPPDEQQVIGMETPDLKKIKEQISEIHDKDPASFNTIKEVVSTYAKKVKSNSKVERLARARVKSAAKNIRYKITRDKDAQAKHLSSTDGSGHGTHHGSGPATPSQEKPAK